MADTTLFARLKRLFSTNAVIRNVGGNQLRVMDLDRIQAYGNLESNALYDKFDKIHKSTNSQLYNPALNYQTLRVQLYSDYEAMDTDSIVASALDIISDECTLKNEMGEVLQIRSTDERIQKILYNLFYDVLNIEFNLWTWIRNMCKYGDFYLKLEMMEKFGIINVYPLPVYDTSREEGSDPKNPSYTFFKPNQNSTVRYNPDNADKYENYEVAHFRLLSDTNFLPYGRSYIEPARKTWKQLSLMEDAMLIHRIMRAPEKRVFYINVGNIPPNEVENFMQKTVNKIKKTPYIDPNTGDYNLKFNMQNMTEDFYIPVRGNDSTTRIDTAKGLEYNGIDDVNYLRDKMLAALKIPKAFFGYEKDLTGKATLAAEDIRFARTIERIQRIVLSELHKIALIHLYIQGYNDENLVNFELSLTTPSIIYDQERVALMKEKVELAGSILDKKLFPTDYIYDHIFHLSEEQYEEYRDLIREDAKRAFRTNQIENEGNDPSESGVSYGTPHDLASMYGRGRYGQGEIPDGYDETDPQGRPKEKASIYGTQEHPLGKDPIGKQAIKPSKAPNERPNTQDLAEMAQVEFFKNKDMLKNIPTGKRTILFENKESILDEQNIKDI